jgi:DNA-binding response OmpR family regulator
VTSLEELIRVLGERVEEDGKPQALLPVPGAATAMVAPSIPVAPAAGTATFPRILVADDDPQMRRLIRTVLQREGFEVAEADDGLDTLEAIDRGGIDLLILDIEMPRLDGLGVMEELRAQMRTATLPVIMLTAQHGESEEKALDLGAQDYLTKPVQTRSLVARVRAVLKRVTS